MAFSDVSKVSVRAQRPEDSEQLAELYNLPGFLQGTLRLPFRTPEEVRRDFENAPSTDLLLVAAAGAQIIGQARLVRGRDRRAHTARLFLGVHDDWTRRGVGTALLRAMIDSADNWLAIKRLELAIYADNGAAKALCEKNGFEVEGLMRSYAFRSGRLVDALSMARILKGK